ATGIGAEAARSIAAIMSPLVTRPSLPEPGTVETSMPVSAAILRTEGASGTAASGFVPVCGRGVSAAAGGVVAVLLSRPRSRGFSDLTEQRADRDRLAVLGRDVAEHAGCRGGHLDRHLVGLEFDQRLVDSDRIARLLEPLADGRLGHRFAERGHADLSHVPSFLPRGARPDGRPRTSAPRVLRRSCAAIPAPRRAAP